MPQDRPRYRSFLTCDDPRGVVECKRIRKSSAGLPKMNDKLVKQSEHVNVNMNMKKECEEMISKVSADELKSSCSIQLMEVSRGTQKLTRVVDSWSRGVGFDRKSKDVAKDLLRGALDLQESLEMLEKLQEATDLMVKLNNKNGKGELSSAVVERTKSERIVGDHKYKEEFHKPRRSVDGASWDCYEELREAIRDGFARQHSKKATFDSRGEVEFSPDLLSTSSSQSSYEKACLDRRRLLSSPDLPSTSSSQSSMFQSQEFPTFESSLPKVKPKATNLIAKLMGLEEIPSNPLQFTSHKQLESNQRRPTFEIDLPKAKKPPSVVSDLEDKFAHYCTPIVVMKPLYSRTYPREEYAVDSKEMHTKWKRKEFTPEITKGAPNITVNRNSRAEKGKVTKWAKQQGEVLVSPNENGVRTPGRLSSSKTTSPTKPRLEKKEVIEKRVDKIQKVVPNMRKEVKFREAAKPHDLEKMASVKLRKQEVVPNISQKRVIQQKSTISDLTQNHASASHNSRNKKCVQKTEKPMTNPSVAIVENLGDKKAQIDLKPEKQTDKTEKKSEVSEKLHLDEEVSDVSHPLIVDKHTNAESLSCIESESSCECKEYDRYCIRPKSNPESNTTKNLLLSSVSFLSHAEELFNANVWRPVVVKRDNSHEETAETKLLLDCASELLENKKLQIECVDLLPIRSEVLISMEKLVAELCDGMETLRSYKDLNTTLSADTLYGFVERDLWCNGGVSGLWDSGWRKGFTGDEVEHVVADMEKLLLGTILEDALADFA